jgi:hypothetical protein
VCGRCGGGRSGSSDGPSLTGSGRGFEFRCAITSWVIASKYLSRTGVYEFGNIHPEMEVRFVYPEILSSQNGNLAAPCNCC